MQPGGRQPLKSTIFKTSIKASTGSVTASGLLDHPDLLPEGSGGRVRGLVTNREALDLVPLLPETGKP
jgi:hypothetical protein